MRQMTWYLTRLRLMSVRELLHRVHEQAWVLWLWFRYVGGFVPAPPETDRLGFCRAAERQLPVLTWRNELGDCGAEDLRGWGALGFPWSWSETAEAWHGAPDTGKVWPDTFFGAIPYRHGNPFGDARVVWEPSRLQQLVWLARIAQKTERRSSVAAVKQARAELLSWVKYNPPWTGVHHVSAMECALRFIAACHALDMLRAHLPKEDPVWTGLAAIVASHPPLIARRLSRYSSSGNHTVAEAAALVYAGVLFPEMKAARRWLENGKNVLCEEAERQVLSDGGGVEQSFHYHKFVVELIVLVEKLLRHHGLHSPPELTAAQARGASFLSHVADAQGQLPPIGDSDSGYALSPDLAILPCDRPVGSYVNAFEHSGYTVIHIDSPPSVHLIFDHGPFGMPPAYGHAHCDALALYMSVDGVPQLLDSGTFTYTGNQDWRTYFRSSRAHNTVTVNNHDPAKQESPFQWSRTFEARLVEKQSAEEGRIRLLASHRGYHRDGVTHWRYIAIFGRPVIVVVLDVLVGAGDHRLELNWHVPAGFTDETDNVFRGSHLWVSLSGGRSSLVEGDKSTDLRAWCSPIYGALDAAACISSHYQGELPHEFVSIICINHATPDSAEIDRELTQGRQWIAKYRNE